MSSNTNEFNDLHWLLDIIQSADIGMVVLDKDFTIQIFNRFMQVHSNIGPEDAIGENVFGLFPYLNDDWFTRRVNTVFELGISVYTTWQERANVFEFSLELPIHHEMSAMFQNSTFIPLRNAADQVEKVGLVIYDVTDAAANAIKLEKAKEQLLLLSRIDKLTGLWNRGYWEERFTEEFKRNKRHQERDLCVVMLDIDHFKNINDTYGHQVGDDAIREVSRIILDNAREVDICGRYGGEEFSIVLPHTNLDGAKVFCERLRLAIERNIVRSAGKEITFTVSLGIAMWDAQFAYATDWLVASDKACLLYTSDAADE